MRILTRKIYRAFPELDKFEDEACKRYVIRAKQMHNAWKGKALLLFVLVSTFIFWIPVMAVLSIVVGYSVSFFGLDDIWVSAILIGPFTGIGWFPLLCFLLTRDRLLHRSIRKQLDGAACRGCAYSLVGLAIFNISDCQAVQCPECGQTTTLKDLDLTEADIDPTLETSS